jgi:hypothetical protein
VCSVPQGPPSTYRANGKAVERTQVPSRRSEPRLFTVAPRKTPAEPNEGVHFSRERRHTLDGAHRRTRGREAVPMAQHAIGTICLRRPNDVLRNVSLASRCPEQKDTKLIN